VAFLALFDSIVPGIVDMSTVSGSNDHENLARAFALFEEHLFVPQLMAVSDFDDRVDKNSVITYVTQIKNAQARHDLANERANEQEDQHRGKADEYYQKGVGKLTKASTDAGDMIVYLVENFTNALAETEDPSAYDTLKADAMQQLEGLFGGFDEASGLFENAKGEYSQINDDHCKGMAGECDTRIEECKEKKDYLKNLLDEKLVKVIRDDKERREFDHVKELYDKTAEENQIVLTDLIKSSVDGIEKSKSGSERDQILDDTNEKVDKLIDKMDKVGTFVDEATKVVTDEGKLEELKQIKEAVTVYPESIRRLVKLSLDEVVKNAGKNDEMSAADLLKIYHKFSVDMDTASGRRVDPISGRVLSAEDEGVPESMQTVRLRLDRIVTQLESLYETEMNLREKVQGSLDVVFDNESLLGEHWNKVGPRFKWENDNSSAGRHLAGRQA